MSAVREGGLEPPRPKTPAPKAVPSTNSGTRARRYRTARARALTGPGVNRQGPVRGRRGGVGGRGQKVGSLAWARAMARASSSVLTEGGEPSSGCWAVSFMHSTEMMPSTAAPEA